MTQIQRSFKDGQFQAEMRETPCQERTLQSGFLSMFMIGALKNASTESAFTRSHWQNSG